MTDANWQEPPGAVISPPPDFAEVPEQQSTWPTVIGVISIVLGSLGVVSYGCCGTFGVLIGPMMMNMAPAEEIDPASKAQMDVMQQFTWPALASGLIASVL